MTIEVSEKVSYERDVPNEEGVLLKNDNIKILAKGEFKSKIKFVGFNFSKNAKIIVEKNGGNFESLSDK